ncbi:MAG: endonuclease NucS domain-containing protein, partial [Promethearchaeia archaeon]
MSGLDNLWSEEQEDILNRLRRYKKDAEVEQWHQHGLQRSREFNDELEDANFRQKDLTADQIERLFHLMRRMVRNRALSRRLYEQNGIDEFNENLRALLFGSAPLAERINIFLRMRGVGKMTTSHFLFMNNPNKFPILSWTFEQILDVEVQQAEEAEDIAYTRYDIPEDHDYYDWTIDILRSFVLYQSVKSILDVDDHIMLNAIFWKESQMEPEEEEVPFATVSLEKDLRHYLAENPDVLESGLVLIDEEYDTSEVGRMDLLFRDSEGAYVVVEAKKGSSSDKVVGQILRYVGWVHNNLGE